MCHIVSLLDSFGYAPVHPMHKSPKTQEICTKHFLVLSHVQDGKPSDDNNDREERSFLEERPETPAAERGDHGDSGLEPSAKEAAIAAAGLALGGELLHQRARSRSTSPPAGEKALDLAPKSQSRP